MHKNYAGTYNYYSKHLVIYRGIDTWNNLPESLKEIKTYYSLKNIYIYLLSNTNICFTLMMVDIAHRTFSEYL